MLPDRYYVAEVREGTKVRRLYFYADVVGLTDPEYGYVEDHSWIEPAYVHVVNDVENRLSMQPAGFEMVPGASVTVSEPREVSREEMERHHPAVNRPVLNAIFQAEAELGDALRPIRAIWHWQVSDEAGGEAAVHLKLEDDVTATGKLFAVWQLKDESLTRELIRRTYQELLSISSRKLILGMLRQRAGAGKD